MPEHPSRKENTLSDYLPYILWTLGGITFLIAVVQILWRILLKTSFLPASFASTTIAWYYLFMYYGFRIFWERRELYTVASVTVRTLGGCTAIILVNEVLTGIDRELISIEAGYMISSLRMFVLMSGLAWAMALLHKLVMVARKPFVETAWTALELLTATGFVFMVTSIYIPVKVHLIWIAGGITVWMVLALQQKWIGLLSRDEHLLNAILMVVLLAELSWLTYLFYRYMPVEMIGVFVLNVPVILSLGFCLVYVLVGFLALSFTFPYHSIIRQKEAQFKALTELILKSQREIQTHRIFTEVLHASMETTDSEGGIIEVEVPALEIAFFNGTGIRTPQTTLNQIKEVLHHTRELEINKRRTAPIPLPETIGSLLAVHRPLKSGSINIYLFKGYQYGYDLYMKERVQQLVNQLAFVLDYMIAEQERQRTERIRHEMQVARSVQLHLLEIKADPWQKHIAVVFDPATETSGDLYLVKATHPNTLHIVVADVVGKGMKAAMYMAVLRGTLETALSGDKPLEERYQICSQAMNDILTTGDFITLTWAVVHAHKDHGQVELLRAGHCPPFNFSAAGSASWIEEGAGPPIGVGKAPIKSARITLKRGEWLILLSDGLVEGTVSVPPQNTTSLLGYEGAARLLSTACRESPTPAHFPQIIQEHLRRLHFATTDDLTIVAFRY